MKKFLISILFLCVQFLQASTISGISFLYPAPDSKNVSSKTPIIIRFAHTLELKAVQVDSLLYVKSKGAATPGRTQLAADGRTLIFKPEHTFSPGARVQVAMNPPAGVSIDMYSYEFTTATFETKGPWLDEALAKKSARDAAQGFPRIMPNGVSVPKDFPHIQVSTHKETADGYIFVHNIRDKAPYNILFDNDGSPVWYERWPNEDVRRDFTVQKNGVITMHTRRDGNKYEGFDQNFNLIEEYVPDGGYYNDGHELQVLENGNYLIIGRRIVQVDASRYVPGGNTKAQVQETTMQEFTPDHEMIFNWPALDHLIDGMPYLQIDDPRAKSFRFPHFNAIDVDKDDDHLLVSSRMLSEITKVDRETGDIIWRLGGHHSDFRFVNDPLNGFNGQHDIRSLGNNRYSVFDNGNYHLPQQSRGVVYELDLETMTATLVWQYTLPAEANFSYYMGNMQHMPNGNFLINWAVGELPKATEVTPAGEVVYEMNFIGHYDAYRTFRHPWSGVVDKPRLFVEQDDVSTILIFNKFGDNNVEYYNIYAGFEPRPTALLDTSRATMKRFSDLVDKRRYYFRVTAVDQHGRESAFSNEGNVFVSYLKPGVNMLQNGDFALGATYWDFTVTDADAELHPVDGEVKVHITDPGNDYDTIQLSQENMALIQGRSYRLEFDAYATNNRIINAIVEQQDYPWNNYGKINPTALRRSMHRFTYDFQMEDRSDFNARVVFNCGGMPGDVFFDNVSLTIIDNAALLEDLPEPWQHSDIGQPTQPGVAGIKDNQFIVIGGGENIFGSSDECHFAYQEVRTDVEFSAHISSISKTHPLAKAGIMIRKSLSAGSANAMVGASASNGFFMQHRALDNKVTTRRTLSETEVPRWVKIIKSGDTLTGYESRDGESWNLITSVDIKLGESFYVGCAVTSRNDDALCSGYFGDVTLKEKTSSAESEAHVQDFALHPAFPNPFNPKTSIAFELPHEAHVKLNVYNVRGELVDELIDARMPLGVHRFEFDASNKSSGLYFYELHAKTINGTRFHDWRKMTVIK